MVKNSRDGLMIQSHSKLFKAIQGFFGKNFSFLKTEWKNGGGLCALASLLLTSLVAVTQSSFANGGRPIGPFAR
jgi:hypothetical protein